MALDYLAAAAWAEAVRASADRADSVAPLGRGTGDTLGDNRVPDMRGLADGGISTFRAVWAEEEELDEKLP